MRHVGEGEVRPGVGVSGPEEEELEERPLGELVSELFAEGRTLLREEVRVARAEVRREARKAARAGAVLAAGGLVLHAAVLCLAAALVLLGATFLPAWGSALIVAAFLGGVGYAAIAMGRRRLAETHPSRAVRHLKEDGRWARETMRSIGSNGRGNA